MCGTFIDRVTKSKQSEERKVTGRNRKLIKQIQFFSLRLSIKKRAEMIDLLVDVSDVQCTHMCYVCAAYCTCAAYVLCAERVRAGAAYLLRDLCVAYELSFLRECLRCDNIVITYFLCNCGTMRVCIFCLFISPFDVVFHFRFRFSIRFSLFAFRVTVCSFLLRFKQKPFNPKKQRKNNFCTKIIQHKNLRLFLTSF